MTTVLSSSEVAYLLRKYLGPMRAWDFALTDMRRGRTHVFNQVLEPTCQVKDDRAWRPYYAATAVLTFIKAVRAACATARAGVSVTARMVDIDPADRRSWGSRRLAAATSTS